MDAAKRIAPHPVQFAETLMAVLADILKARLWCSGNTAAFQASDEGPIPSGRFSDEKPLPFGGAF